MIFQTDHIICRKFKNEDIEDLIELYSFENTFKYEFEHPLETFEIEDQLRAIIEAYKYDKIHNYQYAIEEKESNKMIGLLIYEFKDPMNLVCEIGGWLNEEYMGKGIAYSIGKKAIEFLFENGVKKIFCSTAFQNKRSVNLIEKLGFEKEGHVKMAIWLKGAYIDEVLYGMYGQQV